MLLNRYIAPGIAEFSACELPDLKAEHPQADHWLANHFLNTVFRAEYEGKHRQYAVNIIYRAQACFDQYHQARDLTLEYLEQSDPDNPKSRIYFAAITTWEAYFLNLQTFVEVLCRLTGKRIFEQADDSPEQRAYSIANTIKHWGGSIGRDEHHDDDTIPLWLTNTGFRTRTEHLAYAEFAALIRESAVAAEDLVDPYERTKKADD